MKKIMPDEEQLDNQAQQWQADNDQDHAAAVRQQKQKEELGLADVATGKIGKASQNIAQGMLTGKVLANKSTPMKVLIISGAVIAIVAAGAGAGVLGKCFKESPGLTIIVVAGWILLAIAIIIGIIYVIALGFCATLLGKWGAKVIHWVSGDIPDVCKFFSG